MLVKLEEHAKIGGVASNKANVLWNDLSQLARWLHLNKINFNKDKCKDINLSTGNAGHSYRMEHWKKTDSKTVGGKELSVNSQCNTVAK